MCHAGGNWGEPSAVVKFWAGGEVEGEESISLNSNCGYLLFPNFWLPKKKKQVFPLKPLVPTCLSTQRALALTRALSLSGGLLLCQRLYRACGCHPAPPLPRHIILCEEAAPDQAGTSV